VLYMKEERISLKGSCSESESSGPEDDWADGESLLLCWFSCVVFWFLRLLLSLSPPPFGVLYVIVDVSG
jgi:hypothetical protein